MARRNRHYETLTIRWTPRVKRAIFIYIVFVLMVGMILGFTFGVLTGFKIASNDKKAPDVIPTESIETPTESAPEIPEEIPTKIYYDCPLSEDLQDYIFEQCEEKGLPPLVVISLIKVESDFRADVISKTNDYGLMQINKCNHEWLSEEYGITDFLDPYQNVFCGITILSEHYNRFGDMDKALMAYNLGATGAKRKWDIGIYKTTYTERIRTAMGEYAEG